MDKSNSLAVNQNEMGVWGEKAFAISLGLELVPIFPCFFVHKEPSCTRKLEEAFTSQSTEGEGFSSYKIYTDVQQKQTTHNAENIRRLN